MLKTQLTAVFRKTKETRYGMKPQLSIKVAEHGDKWLSTWSVRGTEGWAIGDTVAINVEQNGDFLNFKPVSADAVANAGLEERVKRLEDQVFGAQTASKPATAPTEPVIQAEDLPDNWDESTDDGF